MARPTSNYRCAQCGTASPRWSGKCADCGAWNTLEERPLPARGSLRRSGASEVAPVPLASVDPLGGRPVATGVGEVDRVLAGGLLAGSVTLVYGEPGVGKSTLLLQVLMARARGGATVLLVSAEESATQVRARAERLGPLPAGLLVSATSDITDALRAIEDLDPALVVVDSIQTVVDPDVGGGSGALAQVRACADRLTRVAKQRGTPVLLVGQVTKDGDLAGPRALEHLVDTVCSFEGDRHHALRLLRAVKHRFGPTGEVGLFEMGEEGLRTVVDPGPLLLGDRRPDVPGSAITALLEGRRPLLVELQALGCAGTPGAPRRNTQGVDPRRLATVLAVLECRAAVPLGSLELFVSAAGGIRATEPAADLPLALAVASSVAGVALAPDVVSFGEVGLAGELRGVPGSDRRLAEAARLGFRCALVPTSTPDGPPALRLLRVASVTEALVVARRLADAGGGAEEPHVAEAHLLENRAPRASMIPQFSPFESAPGPPGTMPEWATPAANR